jgi:hypothetical protein
MLEQSLQAFQEHVEGALQQVGGLTRRLKKLDGAAHSGDLREIAKGLGEIAAVASACGETIARLEFRFEEEAWFPDAFLSELTDAAKAAGMNVYALDGKLYCYPLLVRVKSAERAVQIGKKTERGVRPSTLLARLRAMQAKPARFKPESFLELLFKVWKRCARETLKGRSNISPLSEIYDLLTLMPGSGKDYTREEFARDLYLLDRSGVNRTRDGSEMSLPASTGTRNATAVFLCIAEDGSEKRYYGIGFAQPTEVTA